MMACSAAVRTRIDTRSMRPTGRRPASLSGKRSEPFRLRPASVLGMPLVYGPTVADGGSVAIAAQHRGRLFGAPGAPIASGAIGAGFSVRAGQRQHLCALTLGKPAPDPVGLMHLQGVCPAGGHCRAFEADRFGLRLPARPSRSALALWMEEERTRHPATRRVQLPIPQVGIGPGKAPGVSHIDPLGSLQRHRFRRSSNQICGGQISLLPTSPGIWARSTTRANGPDRGAGAAPNFRPDLPRCSRIRADPGAVVEQTLERFSGFDKSLIMFFVDLDRSLPVACAGSETRTVPSWMCGIAHTPGRPVGDFKGWLLSPRRLLSVVGVDKFALNCPKDPLWGPYRCFVDDQGSVGSAVAIPQLPSTSSAGGVT
jgi:hypothetical protein